MEFREHWLESCMIGISGNKKQSVRASNLQLTNGSVELTHILFSIGVRWNLLSYNKIPGVHKKVCIQQSQTPLAMNSRDEQSF